MTTKKPLLGIKSVDEKLADNPEPILTPAEIKVEHYPIEKSYFEKQQAMKKFGLVSPKKGSRVDIDHELHNRFKIAAIKMNKTQKDWMEEIIEEAVLKAEKRLEKII